MTVRRSGESQAEANRPPATMGELSPSIIRDSCTFTLIKYGIVRTPLKGDPTILSAATDDLEKMVIGHAETAHRIGVNYGIDLAFTVLQEMASGAVPLAALRAEVEARKQAQLEASI